MTHVASKAKIVQHIKKGSQYEVVLIYPIERACKEGDVIPIKIRRPPLYATIQCSRRDLRVGDLIVVYRGLQDRKLWGREVSEFNDGRFVVIED